MNKSITAENVERIKKLHPNKALGLYNSPVSSSKLYKNS